jgi:hypothetical protein
VVTVLLVPVVFGLGQLTHRACRRCGEAAPLLGMVLATALVELYFALAVGVPLLLSSATHWPFMSGAGVMAVYLLTGIYIGIVVGLANGVAAWKHVREARPRNPEDVRVYWPAQVALGAFLGGPIAAATLMGANYSNTGRRTQARAALVTGLVVFLALLVLGLELHRQLHGAITLLVSSCTVLLAACLAWLLQGDSFRRGLWVAVRKASYVRTAGVGVCSLGAAVVIVFAVAAPWFYLRYGPLLRLQQAIVLGRTAEVQAILRDHPRVVRLRELGSGETALHMAAGFDKTGDIVRMLVQAGADVNARDDEPGWVPLHRAAMFGRAEAARALCEAGADVNARWELSQQTPLHKAAGWGNVETIQVLVAHGADVNARDFLKVTPICEAAGMGKTDAVRALLDAGAEVRDHAGSVALYRAEDGRHEDIARLLREHGAVLAK